MRKDVTLSDREGVTCQELHRQSIGENATREEVDSVRAAGELGRESSRRVQTGEPSEIDLPILYFTSDPNSTFELAVHLRPTSGLATVRPQSPGHVLIAMVVPGTSVSRNAARQSERGCRADLNRLI